MEQCDRDLLLALGRLEGKVDALVSSVATQAGTTRLHDGRLRTLETSRSALIGAVAILSTAISALVAYFSG